jgi:hypothetical protein
VVRRGGEGNKRKLIMKDISTVPYKSQRLWERSRIALEVAEQFVR